MRYNKILFITPPVQTELGPVRPNIGLGYLAEYVYAHGIEYDVLDMLLGYSLEDLDHKIATFMPDLVAVNLFSNKYKTAYATLEYIKKKHPNIMVVAGGPHVSCLTAKVLEDCQGIDFGVYLEGEDALLELCRGVEPKDIQNLIFRDGSKVIVNPARAFIKDLDSLPFPTYAHFPMDGYIREKAIISSRGCPFNCTYCAVKVVSGRKVRLRSPGNVVDEIEYWYKKGCRQFSFQDDHFTLHKDRVLEICDEIERRGISGVMFRCAGARADSLDYDILYRMRETGFKTIAIGVEVGNDRMLKIIKKGESFNDIDLAVRTACELDYDVYLNFLAGVPHETLDDIRDSINFALKYPVFYAEWSNIIPYPQTEMYEWLSQKGYLLKDYQEYLNDDSTVSTSPVFETPELPVRARERIFVRLKGVRKKILARAMSRRLGKMRLPWGLRHAAGYVVSRDSISKFLFQNRLRKIADAIRFKLYST